MQITNDILRLIQHAALFDESEPPISAELWQQILTADLETPVDIEADTHTIAILLSWARDVYVGQGDVFRGRLALRAIENLRNQPPAAARLSVDSPPEQLWAGAPPPARLALGHQPKLPAAILDAWDDKGGFQKDFYMEGALTLTEVRELAQWRANIVYVQLNNLVQQYKNQYGSQTLAETPDARKNFITRVRAIGPTVEQIRTGTIPDSFLPPIERALFGNFVSSPFGFFALSGKGDPHAVTGPINAMVGILEFINDPSNNPHRLNFDTISQTTWEGQLGFIEKMLVTYKQAIAQGILVTVPVLNSLNQVSQSELADIETKTYNMFREFQDRFYEVGENIGIPRATLWSLLANLTRDYSPAVSAEERRGYSAEQAARDLTDYAVKIRRFLNFLTAHEQFVEQHGDPDVSVKYFFIAAQASPKFPYLTDAHVEELAGGSQRIWRGEHLYPDTRNPFTRPPATDQEAVIRYVLGEGYVPEGMKGVQETLIRLNYLSWRSNLGVLRKNFEKVRDAVLEGLQFQMAHHLGIPPQQVRLIDAEAKRLFVVSDGVDEQVGLKVFLREGLQQVRFQYSLPPAALVPLSDFGVVTQRASVSQLAYAHAAVVAEGIRVLLQNWREISNPQTSNKQHIQEFVSALKQIGPTKTEQFLNQKTDLTRPEFRLYGDLVYAPFGMTDGRSVFEGMVPQVIRRLEAMLKLKGQVPPDQLNREIDLLERRVRFFESLVDLDRNEILADQLIGKKSLYLLFNGPSLLEGMEDPANPALTEIPEVRKKQFESKTNLLKKQFLSLLTELKVSQVDHQKLLTLFDATYSDNAWIELLSASLAGGQSAYHDGAVERIFAEAEAIDQKLLNFIKVNRYRLLQSASDASVRADVLNRLYQALSPDAFLREYLADAHQQLDAVGDRAIWTAVRDQSKTAQYGASKYSAVDEITLALIAEGVEKQLAESRGLLPTQRRELSTYHYRQVVRGKAFNYPQRAMLRR